jgi:hypothetical protein
MQPSSPLLDQLVEVSKSDYRDDWSRLLQLEGQSEEAARWRLHEYSKRYSAVGIPPEVATLCEKFVKHFTDVYRDRLVGRRKGDPETRRIPPALIQPQALRFCPDELVLDKGQLVFVDVRVELVPQIPDSVARTGADEERRRKDRERKRRQRARAKTSSDVPVTSADIRVTSAEPPGRKPGRDSAKGRAWEIAESILNNVASQLPRRGGRLVLRKLADRVRPQLAVEGWQYEANSIEKMIRADVRKWEKQNPDK